MRDLTDPGTITALLRQAESGSDRAKNELFDLVYADLRRIAGGLLRRRRRGRDGGVLCVTSLVSAACERLLERGEANAANRRHFFFIFKRAMHHVIAEEARAAAAAKRGGGWTRVPFLEFDIDGERTHVTMLEFHDALEEFRRVDSEGAKVAEMRLLAGCTLEETAELTGLTFAQVRANWSYARAWLAERLSGSSRAG